MMLKHKIIVSKKNVEIPKMDELENFGKMQIVVSWPEVSFISYEGSFLDNRVDVIQKRSEQIEKIMMKAMDEIAEVSTGGNDDE